MFHKGKRVFGTRSLSQKDQHALMRIEKEIRDKPYHHKWFTGLSAHNYIFEPIMKIERTAS